MRKSKFMSILTSIAMTGSMALSALSFTATAADTDLVGLALNSDKTTFTLEEVQAGDASTTVYVDVTTEFDASENISFIEFELWPSEWGTVDPVNLELCDPNVLGTDKGNSTRHFMTAATTTGSLWTKKAPEVFYGLYNFGDVEGFPGYGDAYPPKACVMTSSTTGKLRTGGANAGEHLAQFDVEIPEDAAAGTYTISFYKAKAGIGVITQDENTMDNYTITDLENITITITDDSSTDPTDPSDPTDPTDPTDPGDDFLLGDANLDGKVNVRDCAAIASALANGTADKLPQKNSDYNQDGKVNVRDAAALAADLAKGTVKS